MVIIINGYVALSDLNTGFLYIIAVNLGACLSWGTIDGLIYAISSAMERNNSRNKLIQLRNCLRCPDTVEQIKNSFDDTFLANFDDDGKTAIAKEVMMHIPRTNLVKNQLLTKKEILGWFSIIGIYMTVGLMLALPFLVFPNKLLAWVLSNTLGVTWVTWYGVQLGKSAGKNRWLLGAVMATVSILFLAGSYFIWSGRN
ncbi:MAG: hypothetical protein LBH74_10075 [Nitrososphaerota archaeon]|jgi:VIT1/CCC1 family predicted Fe2+/Mn2+ transporter|nr:hypothetical protein [Nitrososphaerota archaeon]